MTQPATAPATAAATGSSQGNDGRCHSTIFAGNNSPALASQGVSHTQPSQPPISGNAPRGKGGAVSLFRGSNSNAVKAGLSVNELNAEMTVLAAIVRAN